MSNQGGYMDPYILTRLGNSGKWIFSNSIAGSILYSHTKLFQNGFYRPLLYIKETRSNDWCQVLAIGSSDNIWNYIMSFELYINYVSNNTFIYIIYAINIYCIYIKKIVYTMYIMYIVYIIHLYNLILMLFHNELIKKSPKIHCSVVDNNITSGGSLLV